MDDTKESSADNSGTEDLLENEAVDAGTSNENHEASSDTSEEVTSEEQWVVPGRFKTPEDVVTSYRHLEAAYTRDRQELLNLKRAKDEQSRTDPEADISQFAEAVKRNPVEAVRSEARRVLSEYEKSQQAEKFEHTYRQYAQNSEFRELEPTMTELATEVAPFIRGTGLENNPKLLDFLFFAARGIKQADVAKKAEQAGIRTGTNLAAKKTKALIEGSSGSKGNVTKKFDDLSLDEMRKELMKG